MDVVLERLKSRIKSPEMRNPPSSGRARMYLRLYTHLRESIDEREVPAGALMPPTRKLAQAIGISRSTVIKAYELLRMEGYLESVQGSGYTVVSSTSGSDIPKTSPVSDDLRYASLSETGRSYLNNVGLMNTREGHPIAFRPGHPPLDVFPVNQWKRLTNIYWSNINFSGLSYSPSSGILPLKTHIARYLNLSRRVKCDPEQIVIVSGSLQSLYLLGNVLIDPGDIVYLEEPTFPNVISVFSGLKARLRGMELDSEGPDLQRVVPLQQAKLIHVTPAAHYPTGQVMSRSRRQEVVDQASEHGLYIIENDYEHELNNDSNKEPTIFSLDNENRTIYLGTFNRLLHPSLRIGFMVLPPQLLPAVESLLKHSHRFVSPTTQFVLSEFIEHKYLYRHIQKVVEETRRRQKTFREKMSLEMGYELELLSADTLSLQSLYGFRHGMDDKKLVQSLARKNVTAHAYSKCFQSRNKQMGLILGHASTNPTVMSRKLQRVKDFLQNPETQNRYA